jgi:hypothetical protein
MKCKKMEDSIRDLRRKDYVDERRMELAQNHAQWLAQVTKQFGSLHHTLVFVSASSRVTNTTTTCAHFSPNNSTYTVTIIH